jgi:hypothetical protein
VVLLRVLRLFSSLALAVIIVFAITAPLASVLQASGVDGRVYVVVPRSFVGWLEGQGYSLGSLFIAMMSPLDYEGYSYWLRDVVGDRLSLDFRRVARSWEEFYRGNPDVLRSPPIPAVSITITLSKVEGDRVLECTAHYSYSTIDYFIEKGLKLEQAVESSRADPLAHLRKPLVITLNPRMPKGDIKVTCGDLSPIVEELRKAMGGAVRTIGGSSPDAMVAQGGLTQQSTCPAWFTEVWWSDLYNSMNSPPGGWMSNVIYYDGSPVPDSLKLRVWRAYARNWSLAYYYRESLYTLEQAKQYALYELSFRPDSPTRLFREGLYSMDSWVDRAFMNELRQSPTPTPIYAWRDYHERNPNAPREWSGWHPLLGVYLHNPNNKPFGVFGSFAIFQNRYYKHGIGIAGFIFIGSEGVTPITTINIPLGASQHRYKEYAVVYSTYRYLGDGMLIRLEVARTQPISGCGSYWRVTVATPTIVPRQSVTLYLDIYGTLSRDDPPLLRNLTYEKYEYTAFYRRLFNIQPGTVYWNSSSDVANVVSNPNLASLVGNLLLNLLWYTAQDIGCPLTPNPGFCRLFLEIASRLVDYVYEDLHAIGLSYAIRVVAQSYVSDATVWVRKTTLVYVNNTYFDIRYRPLMVLFNVSVW